MKTALTQAITQAIDKLEAKKKYQNLHIQYGLEMAIDIVKKFLIVERDSTNNHSIRDACALARFAAAVWRIVLSNTTPKHSHQKQRTMIKEIKVYQCICDNCELMISFGDDYSTFHNKSDLTDWISNEEHSMKIIDGKHICDTCITQDADGNDIIKQIKTENNG